MQILEPCPRPNESEPWKCGTWEISIFENFLRDLMYNLEADTWAKPRSLPLPRLGLVHCPPLPCIHKGHKGNQHRGAYRCQAGNRRGHEKQRGALIPTERSQKCLLCMGAAERHFFPLKEVMWNLQILESLANTNKFHANFPFSHSFIFTPTSHFWGSMNLKLCSSDCAGEGRK